MPSIEEKNSNKRASFFSSFLVFFSMVIIIFKTTTSCLFYLQPLRTSASGTPTHARQMKECGLIVESAKG